MHQFLNFKSKFSNHFAYTLGYYLFLLFLVQFENELSGLAGIFCMKPPNELVLVFYKKGESFAVLPFSCYSKKRVFHLETLTFARRTYNVHTKEAYMCKSRSMTEA